MSIPPPPKKKKKVKQEHVYDLFNFPIKLKGKLNIITFFVFH